MCSWTRIDFVTSEPSWLVEVNSLITCSTLRVAPCVISFMSFTICSALDEMANWCTAIWWDFVDFDLNSVLCIGMIPTHHDALKIAIYDDSIFLIVICSFLQLMAWHTRSAYSTLNSWMISKKVAATHHGFYRLWLAWHYVRVSDWWVFAVCTTDYTNAIG